METENNKCVVDRTMGGARGRLLLPNLVPIVHWNNGEIDLDFAAKVINAALVAERKYYETVRYRKLIEHEAGLSDELATERERCELLVKALKEFENEYPHIRRLLANYG